MASNCPLRISGLVLILVELLVKCHAAKDCDLGTKQWVTACSHLSAIADWGKVTREEQHRSCHYVAPTGWVIINNEIDWERRQGEVDAAVDVINGNVVSNYELEAKKAFDRAIDLAVGMGFENAAMKLKVYYNSVKGIYTSISHSGNPALKGRVRAKGTGGFFSRKMSHISISIQAELECVGGITEQQIFQKLVEDFNLLGEENEEGTSGSSSSGGGNVLPLTGNETDIQILPLGNDEENVSMVMFSSTVSILVLLFFILLTIFFCFWQRLCCFKNRAKKIEIDDQHGDIYTIPIKRPETLYLESPETETLKPPLLPPMPVYKGFVANKQQDSEGKLQLLTPSDPENGQYCHTGRCQDAILSQKRSQLLDEENEINEALEAKFQAFHVQNSNSGSQRTGGHDNEGFETISLETPRENGSVSQKHHLGSHGSQNKGKGIMSSLIQANSGTISSQTGFTRDLGVPLQFGVMANGALNSGVSSQSDPETAGSQLQNGSRPNVAANMQNHRSLSMGNYNSGADIPGNQDSFNQRSVNTGISSQSDPETAGTKLQNGSRPNAAANGTYNSGTNTDKREKGNNAASTQYYQGNSTDCQTDSTNRSSNMDVTSGSGEDQMFMLPSGQRRGSKSLSNTAEESQNNVPNGNGNGNGKVKKSQSRKESIFEAGRKLLVALPPIRGAAKSKETSELSKTPSENAFTHQQSPTRNEGNAKIKSNRISQGLQTAEPRPRSVESQFPTSKGIEKSEQTEKEAKSRPSSGNSYKEYSRKGTLEGSYPIQNQNQINGYNGNDDYTEMASWWSVVPSSIRESLGLNPQNGNAEGGLVPVNIGRNGSRGKIFIPQEKLAYLTNEAEKVHNSSTGVEGFHMPLAFPEPPPSYEEAQKSATLEDLPGFVKVQDYILTVMSSQGEVLGLTRS